MAHLSSQERGTSGPSVALPRGRHAQCGQISARSARRIRSNEGSCRMIAPFLLAVVGRRSLPARSGEPPGTLHPEGRTATARSFERSSPRGGEAHISPGPQLDRSYRAARKSNGRRCPTQAGRGKVRCDSRSFAEQSPRDDRDGAPEGLRRLVLEPGTHVRAPASESRPHRARPEPSAPDRRGAASTHRVIALASLRCVATALSSLDAVDARPRGRDRWRGE